jgi:O-antigen/teichoic acid export membrane protein
MQLFKSLLKSDLFLRNAWSILDQAVYAGSNFLINIAVSRMLNAAEYGVFSLIQILSLSLIIFYGGSIVDPTVVYAQKLYKNSVTAYIKQVLNLSLVLSIPLFICVLLGVINYAKAFEQSLLLSASVIVSSFFVMAMTIIRRMCYIYELPQWSLYCGLLYGFIYFAAFELLRVRGTVSNTAIFFIIAGSAASSLCVLIYVFTKREILGSKGQLDVVSFTETAKRHYAFGSWLVLSGLVNWIPSNSGVLLLSYFHSSTLVGEFRIIFNLIMPSTNIALAISAAFLSTMHSPNSENELWTKFIQYGKIQAFLSIILIAVIFAISEPLLLTLYGKDSIHLVWYLRLMSVTTFFFSLLSVCSAYIKYLEKSRAIFVVNLSVGLLSIVVYYILVKNYSMLGAIMGNIFTDIAICICFGFVILRHRKNYREALI